MFIIVDFLDGGEFGKSVMAYLLPFIYTPIIFVLSLVVAYIWLKLSEKKMVNHGDNKIKDTND